MAEADLSPGQRRRTLRSRWFRWLLLALVGGVVLVGLLLAALPSLLSSDTFRHRLEQEASRVLGRPLHVGTLELGWDGGFRLGEVRVEDTPEFATEPLLALNQLVIKVDSLGLLRQRAAV